VVGFETLFDAVHQDVEPGRILAEPGIKPHEVAMKRIFVLVPNEECARLFTEIEDAPPQSSSMRRNSQGF
jgi:hypothetical protein